MMDKNEIKKHLFEKVVFDKIFGGITIHRKEDDDLHGICNYRILRLTTPKRLGFERRRRFKTNKVATIRLNEDDGDKVIKYAPFLFKMKDVTAVFNRSIIDHYLKTCFLERIYEFRKNYE